MGEINGREMHELALSESMNRWAGVAFRRTRGLAFSGTAAPPSHANNGPNQQSDVEGKGSWKREQGEPRPAHAMLTMPQNDLSIVVGGSGRARMVWDLLRRGLDPVYIHTYKDKMYPP